MAGAGAKKFPAFSKLASDDVNNYLADQVVMRFATTTARDAAFGGAGEPTLAEGMCAYIDADNSIYTYDGSNWVKMVSASQPVGLVLVRSGTLSSSGTNFEGCFTDEFRDYRIVLSNCQLIGTAGFTVDMCFVYLNGSTQVTNDYYFAYRGLNSSGGSMDLSANASALGRTGGYSQTNAQYRMGVTMDIYAPKLAVVTMMTSIAYSLGASDYGSRSGGCAHNLNVAYDGIRFQSAGGQTVAGDVRIYGYRI